MSLNKRWPYLSGAAFLVCIPIVLWQQASVGQERRPKADATPDQVLISGPYIHENLTVFLLHGKDALAGRKFLTLQEALEQQKVRVHETGNVNELAIENLSKDEEVFIQAGEIVRGGKQDRALGVDMVLSPQSGKVSISAFCVEQGRWSQRGTEILACFSASENMAIGNDVKLAIVKDCDQSGVWAAVANNQALLVENVGAGAVDSLSSTSLELSLESDEVEQGIASYTEKLMGIIEGKDDVVGAVIVINGKLHSADSYASPDLFRKLWPKLLAAAATEALGARSKEVSDAAVSVSDVRGFLASAENAKPDERKISPRIRVVTRESAETVLVETFAKECGGIGIHRSYIRK